MGHEDSENLFDRVIDRVGGWTRGVGVGYWAEDVARASPAVVLSADYRYYYRGSNRLATVG